MSLSNINILLCVTGSVAAIRTPRLLIALQSFGANVKIASTFHAHPFIQTEQPLPPNTVVHTDSEEWSSWNILGDPVLHIELRKWAHLLLIAPLSANTLAKLATGLCDNLITCVARAWRVPHAGMFLVAPAMNSEMWLHPVTGAHLQTLKQWGVRVIPPVEKVLACGDVGIGGMERPENIAAIVTNLMAGVAEHCSHVEQET